MIRSSRWRQAAKSNEEVNRMIPQVKCTGCGGLGKKCPACNGLGSIPSTQQISITDLLRDWGGENEISKIRLRETTML